MRVLLLANHYRPGPGGAEAVLLATEALLRERGHEPVPFAVREPDTASTPWAAWFPPVAGARARTEAGHRLAATASRPAQDALHRLLDAASPDVAHVHHVFEGLTLSVVDLLTAAGLLRGLATVEVFGESRLAQALKSRVAREGLPVRLHGFAGRGRLADGLAAATATVLPARWPENCPLAILEAAARAVPAVATTAGGIPELVEDGRTGLLVPPGDPTALAEAMARHHPGGHADALLDCYRRAIARTS